jgi:antitoxin component YwqK of YwqJK toxin-antitoxin module
VKRVANEDLFLGDDYALYDEGKPFTGVSYENRPDGSLWSEMTYVRGLQHGPSRTLYPNGQVQTEMQYKMAYADGWAEEWYPDGALKRRTLYELAVPVREQEFNRKGELIREVAIDPSSEAYRRLEVARRNEDARLDRIYATFGRPVAGET